MCSFSSFRVYAFLLGLLLAGHSAALAQGVGIGTTAPDASAALDIVSGSKGALLPRVASAAAIANPATGLIVYQTGGTPGFYYNAGTPAAPSWQQLATAAAVATTATNGLTKTGTAIGLGGTLAGATTVVQGGNALGFTGGNVGMGTAAPNARLDVEGGGLLVGGYGDVAPQGAHLQWNRTALSNTYEGETWLINTIGGGNTTSAGIRFGGITASGGTTVTEWGRFQNNGFLGIGTPSPGHPLTVRADNATNGRLLGFSDASGTDRYNFSRQAATGSGATAVPGGLNLSESNVAGGRLFVQDGGNVGLGTTTPGQRLTVVSADNLAATDIVKATSNNGASGVSLGYSGLRASGSNANDDLTLDAKGTGDLLLNAANGSAGNVGIGTSAPTQKLEVLGGSVFANGDNAGFLTDNQTSARVGLLKYPGHEGGIWRTSAQDFEIGRVNSAVTALPGSPSSFTTDLYVSGTGSVGLGTTAPSGDAVLDVASTTKGVLLPRLSQAQRDDMSLGKNLAPGLLLYNTTTSRLNCYDGTRWVAPVVEDARTYTEFLYTGTVQTYTVPAGPGSLTLYFDMAGAGNAANDVGGGRLLAGLTVARGSTLYIYVGGTNGQNGAGATATTLSGGPSAAGSTNGGGGASDVRKGPNLNDRLLVAGGAGGTVGGQQGGVGGGTTAGAGGGGPAGGGPGTATAGGAGTNGAASNGSLGQGGNSSSSNGIGGGGGGGYYGGGAGNSNGTGGGGGGSSYAPQPSASAGSAQHFPGYQIGNGYVRIYFQP